MDPITAIVSAIVAGATAALKPTTEQAIKDAYQGLKAIIVKKWKDLDLSGIEAKPDSSGRKMVLEEELTGVGVQNDAAIVSAAEKLLNTIHQLDPDCVLKAGVKLSDIDVNGNVRINDIKGEDRGVDISSAKIGQDLEISGVTQQSSWENPQNPR